MSKSHLGIKHTEEHKKNVSNSKKAEKNGMWKGGISPESEKIRGNRDYKLWRKEVFIRDNFICQKCSQKAGILNAHHIESFNNNPELRTQVNNGITLCKNCHKNFHHQYGRGNNNKNQLIKFLEGK